MVRRGMRILSGVNISITRLDRIEQILTPHPTYSDKDSPDIGVKLRYLIDRVEDQLTTLDIIGARLYDVSEGKSITAILKEVRDQLSTGIKATISSTRSLYTFGPYTVSTSPVETDVVDLSSYGGEKMIFIENTQDTAVNVSFLAAPTVSGPFAEVRPAVSIAPGRTVYAVARSRFPFMKFRLWSTAPPSSGSVKLYISVWTL